MMIYKGMVLNNEYDKKALDEITSSHRTAAMIQHENMVADIVLHKYMSMQGALNTFIGESTPAEIRDEMGDIWTAETNMFIYMVEELHYWELARKDLKQYDIYLTICKELKEGLEAHERSKKIKDVPAILRNEK